MFGRNHNSPLQFSFASLGSQMDAILVYSIWRTNYNNYTDGAFKLLKHLVPLNASETSAYLASNQGHLAMQPDPGKLPQMKTLRLVRGLRQGSGWFRVIWRDLQTRKGHGSILMTNNMGIYRNSMKQQHELCCKSGKPARSVSTCPNESWHR